MSNDNGWFGYVDQGWASLLVLDQDCKILAANQAAERMAEVAPRSVVGKYFCEAFSARPCMSAGGAGVCPLLNVRKGRERREQPRWLPITVHGRNTTALVGARSAPSMAQTDGTPSESTVILVTMVPSSVVDEADRKWREMVAAVIHDMRHPLTMLSLWVELMADTSGTGPRHVSDEMLRGFQRATTQLTATVDDLQNRLIFDSGAIKIEPCEVDVVVLLRQLAWQLDPLLFRRRQRISVALPETLVLWADPSALNQILGNLLINAHKYSTDGDTIEVSARRIPRTEEVEIRVRDHGLGVPHIERRRIFERFYRGQDTAGIQGAGLGLAIVKSLVDTHGGKVGVGAPRGGGALFWVRFPAAAAQAGMTSEKAAILTEP